MPKTFRAAVTIFAETPEEATRVMAERIGPDEDYGFDYTIDWNANWATELEEEQ